MLLGEHKYSTNSEANHLRINVDQIKQYPGYNSNTTDEDFSMLKLKKAVDFSANPHIRPVCLPTDTSETYSDRVGGHGPGPCGGAVQHCLQVSVGCVVYKHVRCDSMFAGMTMGTPAAGSPPA